MNHTHADHDRLNRLRAWRNRPEPDLSLRFLTDQFKRNVQQPYKQLAPLITLWQTLVPGPISRHCRLEGISRGVLRVSVDSSAHLYELDRLLRNGLKRELIARHPGPCLRQIKLRVDPSSRAPARNRG